ncbi:hypothetical protein ACK1X7_07390 [Streptomyces sp. CY1]|uniref:hypothetical protein n=1 Tax=Streptomyces sp. CY1 TaxID=3388313 RepID=UPI0039A02171
MEIKHTRKSLATLLREAGAPSPTFDPAAGGLRYLVNGESMTPGEAAKHFLPACGKCGTTWPPCAHENPDTILDRYKYADGPLKGYFRQDLATLRRNVEWSAYLATPGAPVRDNTGRAPFRPQTTANAAQVREDFERHAQELSHRDPAGYSAWHTAYLVWQSGDLSASMPRPESYATGERR